MYIFFIFQHSFLLSLYTFPSVSPTFSSRSKSWILEGPQNRLLLGWWAGRLTWTVVRQIIFSSLEIKKSNWGPNPTNTVNVVIIRILIPSFWPSTLRRCAPVHCLDGRESFSFSNENVFSWFLRLSDAITTHNTLQLSFVRYPSNRCIDYSAGIPKNRSHHLAGKFHRLRLLRGPFGFKNPLFWLILCLWNLCFVHSYISTQKLVGIILLWKQTRHPSWRDFFHTWFFVQKGKHCTLQYACGLNYFAHFDSSIAQKHIVDFVNHFGGSHFH